MKKITMILVLIVAITMGAVAQPKMSKEMQEKVFNGKAKMMQKKLNLSDEQMIKFLPIYKKYHENIAKIVRPSKKMDKRDSLTIEQAYDLSMKRIEHQEAVLDLQKKTIKELKKVLTPQQLIRFQGAESSVQKKIMEHKNSRKERMQHYGEKKKEYRKSMKDMRQKMREARMDNEDARKKMCESKQ